MNPQRKNSQGVMFVLLGTRSSHMHGDQDTDQKSGLGQRYQGKVEVNVCCVWCGTMLHKPLGVYWQTSYKLRHKTDSIDVLGGTHICSMMTFSLHNRTILLKLLSKLVNNISRRNPPCLKMNTKMSLWFQQYSSFLLKTKQSLFSA
jgi:hypothetical protein